MEKKNTHQTKTITAEEYIYKMLDTHPVKGTQFCVINAGEGSIKAAMIEFAKKHVEAALNAASEQAQVQWYKDRDDYGFVDNARVSTDSILNSYSLDSIK